ncbi:MAG: hypothetical protein JW864_03400 [Spirochaetes bacterium]|nr:hypothetical protein [Spirochaetota bacterium]
MTFLSEFSYPEISQRRIIIFNALISFITLGIIYTNASITLKFYFLYRPVLQIIFLTALAGIFAGNMFGRLLFAKLRHYRFFYILTDLIFILACGLYIYTPLLLPGMNNPLITLFFTNQYYTVLPFFIISFFAGLKICYFLKISCGDFLDGKRAVLSFFISAILGFSAGIIIAVVLYYYKEYFIFSGILPVLILPTVFLIKLAYNPKPIYAQEIRDHSGETESGKTNHKRDDLFFIYLNFSYILIYIFLTHVTIVKLFGDSTYIQLVFILTILLSIIIGFILAKIIKQAFWFIYSEMLYPVFFILAFVSLLFFKDITELKAISLFIPLSVILGFSLSHSIDHILLSKKHKNRYSVINFSVFILPLPIITALYFIDFTYFWHFVLIYVVAGLNIFIPGIYLFQSDISGYKKIIYFFLTLFFIPLLILIHLYFKIPMDNNLYVSHTKGFESLNSINYNSSYINDEGIVYIHGIKLFYANDSKIRNMKRSLIPAMLYTDEKSDKILFLDGNRKFFRNPSISLYSNATVLDYVPLRKIDNKRLAVSGGQNYVLINSDMLSFFQENKTRYKIITDIPNLYDQTLNLFKFSGEYYDIIKSHLTEDGIYSQIIDLESCRNEFISGAVKNIKHSFVAAAAFYFPKYIVFVAAKKSDSLKLNSEDLEKFSGKLSSNRDLKNIFYNDHHLVSHLIFSDIDKFSTFTENNIPVDHFYFVRKPSMTKLKNDFNDYYLQNNSEFLSLFDETDSSVYEIKRMKRELSKSENILTDLKNTELLEANKKYEEESLLLTNLKKQAEYIPLLREYLTDILEYKEKHYYKAALKFEKNKEWEEARKLYKAILSINRNNFEANYRLGILSIVLQDIPSSFEYLQYAMKLKKNDPKVLYQMGVLLVTNGMPGEALVYLEKAVELNEKNASIYYYIGLSYEELEILSQAKAFFKKGIEIDPNDKNLISSLKRIEEKIDKRKSRYSPHEKDSNTEAEVGEDMPLQITDSAKNVRKAAEEDNTAGNNQE